MDGFGIAAILGGAGLAFYGIWRHGRGTKEKTPERRSSGNVLQDAVGAEFDLDELRFSRAIRRASGRRIARAA